jgi:hypothetical protein
VQFTDEQVAMFVEPFQRGAGRTLKMASVAASVRSLRSADLGLANVRGSRDAQK